MNGKSTKAFLDTGAKLSYASPALSNGAAALRTERDFYPGVGVFDTDVRELALEVAGASLKLEFGTLPASLTGLLAATGVDAVIGAELLRTHRLAFVPGRGRMVIDRLS